MIYHPFLRLIYKGLALVLLTYVIIVGLMSTLPAVPGLEQSSRSLFFHLPMWFAMYLMMLLSMIWSIQYLRSGKLRHDTRAREAANIGIFFGVLGLLTGMLWSRVTWGSALRDTDPSAWWVWDPKQTLALIAVLIYVAYAVLRNSVEQYRKRAKIAAIYNIFAAASIFPLTYIIPRQLQSLHPGAEGANVDFSPEYRIVLYPAFLGFILLGLWLLELRVRQSEVEETIEEEKPQPQAAN